MNLTPANLTPANLLAATGRRHRRGAGRLAVTLIMAAALTHVPAAPAQAAVGWNDSPPISVATVNCQSVANQTLGSADVGYHGDPASPPAVNTVYYVRVRWQVTGNPCAGARVAPELYLPAGTTLAISAVNPVRCYGRRSSTAPVIQETQACPQAPATGVQGGLGFYAVGQQSPSWPTPLGASWEIQVPVLSTSPLSGAVTTTNPFVACASCVTAGVWFLDGLNNPWAYPRVGVKVSGAATPAITYPTPSATKITGTTASGSAFLDRAGTTGSAYIQIDTTPPAGATCAQGNATWPVTTAFTGTLAVNWTGLSPGTTYHWRFCYQAGGATYWGAHQSFTTTGAPVPKVIGLSREWALPGQQVTLTGTALSGASLALVDTSGASVPVTPTAASGTSLTFPVPSLAAFSGTVQVKTAGGVAHSGPFNLGVDTVIDSATVHAAGGIGPKNDVLVRFHVTEPFPQAKADCTLDLASLTPCNSGEVLWQDVKDGEHWLRATGYVDAGGRTWRDTDPALVHVRIDTTPPNTLIIESPGLGSAVNTTTVPLSFASDEVGASYECGYDGGNWVPCSQATQWSGLTEGWHNFRVRAKDHDGNVDPSPAQIYFFVDHTPPDTTLTEKVTTSLGHARFRMYGTYHVQGPTRYQCSLDNSAYAFCSPPVTYQGLEPGVHTFRVRTMDPAGNVDPTPATWSWEVPAPSRWPWSSW